MNVEKFSLGYYTTEKVLPEPQMSNKKFHGYRTDPFDNSRRIICLGDSYTYAFGSPANYAWPSMLDTPTWNLASPGASCDRILRIWYSVPGNLNFDTAIFLWPDAHRREWYLKDRTHAITGADNDEKLKVNDDTHDTFFKKHCIFLAEHLAKVYKIRTLHYLINDNYDEKLFQQTHLTDVWHNSENKYGPDGMHPDHSCYQNFANIVKNDLSQLTSTNNYA